MERKIYKHLKSREIRNERARVRLERGQSWSEGGVGGGGGAGDVPVYRSDSDDADIIDVEFVSEKKRIMSLVYDCCLFLAKVVFLTFGIHYVLMLLKNYLLQ